jgi:hypothetical protein
MSAVLVRVVGADRFQVVSTAAVKVVIGKGVPIKSIPYILETRRNGFSGDDAKTRFPPARIERPVPS